MLNPDLIHFLSPDSVLVDKTESTMTLARQMLEEGAEHFALVVAEAQTAGRGRRQKTWHTFPGHSLAFTLVLREGGTQLPLVASVALYEVVSGLGLKNVAIKWPNDILVNGKKVAGILAECVQEGEYLLGIGLNVTEPENLPADFAGTTVETEWRQQKNIGAGEGAELLCREHLLNKLLSALHKHLTHYQEQGWQACAKAYTAHCATLGQQVSWQQGNMIQQGVAVGLGPQGELLLEVEGEVLPISSGEIIEQGTQKLDIA